MNNILAIVLSYFIGTISFALIVGYMWKGIDLRKHGSGNLGATNVARTLGIGAGVLVFALDAAKGIASYYASVFLGDGSPLMAVVCGMVVIIGHCMPFYLGFKGGKGVATALGVVLCIVPEIAIIAFIIWSVVLAGSRYVSLASIMAAISVPLMMYYFHVPEVYLLLGVIGAAFVIYRHRGNISKIYKGEEYRIKIKIPFMKRS